MNSALPDESADSLDPALLDMVGSELLSALPKEAHVPSRVFSLSETVINRIVQPGTY